MRRYIQLFTVTLLFNVAANGQDRSKSFEKDSIEISRALHGFVHALEYLDADHLQNFFGKNATVFFPPSALVAGRVQGIDSIMAVFKRFFERVKQTKTGPHYLEIDPEKIKIDIEGNVAIATFELSDNDGLSRRSVVMIKEKDKWIILHLHASKISN